MRHIPMTMQNWVEKLDDFVKINDRDILNHAGKISHEMAKELAENEYDKFHNRRIAELSKNVSDFDKAVKMIEKKNKNEK